MAGKTIPKVKVLKYYQRLWKDPEFRKDITANGVFIRADYNGKGVIRRDIGKIKSFDDMKELIRQHAVEFIGFSRPFLDIDANGPRPDWLVEPSRKALESAGLGVLKVVQTPRGYHILPEKITTVQKLRSVAKGLGVKIGRTPPASSGKPSIDVSRKFRAIPGSLSMRGPPYKVMR